MNKHLHFIFFITSFFLATFSFAQLNNNCANAVNVCNNQLAEQLDDGPGTQECPTGGCGCMLAGEKNTRWFRITVAVGGTLEFTIRPYQGTADYDFSVWNQGVGGSCPSGARLNAPDRCNFASPKSPTGIRGTGGNNSEPASGNLFSNNMTVTAGQVIYILVDNYDGTQEGFYLDFFGGAPGSGTGTTATFSCSSVNQCTTCNDADCKSYYFASPDDYSYDETAANGGCHSNFGYASVKTATVCGTFTVPAPFTTVEFPTNRGYEIITTNGANSTTCLNSAVITYQVWDNCASAPLTPSSPGIYNGLNNVTSYKVCKTITVSGADCWLNRICLPYWTMVQNDVICNATPLTVDAAPIAGTNAGASSDLDAGCTGYQDVYYKFTAPASGRVQVNVVPNGTSDVKVSLIGPMAGLDGGVNDCNLSCTQLGESNVVAGCNDDAGTGGTERLFSFVIPGQTYYVWISGTLFRQTAGFTVQVSQTITNTANPTPGPDIVGSPDAIPSNDACANAINLNPCVASAGTNIGATAECTDPDPIYVDALTLENDVWYKWTAPANNGNSEVTLTVTGVSCTSGLDGSTGIQFGIFRGTCASLTPISHGTTSITFTPIAGQTYYFVIDGNAGAQCNFNIQVKRPIVTSQTCNAASTCAGSSLNATMGITYYGSNPGTRWAYCKSSTYGTGCTIDLDNPATYFVYNPAQGLPSPGCTPATYTFVGYILADNGATTIAPGYPTPQPLTTNCQRQTNACTFNIYPDIKNTVTVTKTNCSQVVTLNGTCSPAAPVTLTGNTNQTAGVGTSGTFTPVTVTWNAPYAASAPAQCSTYTIQNAYNCPGPSGTTTCPGPTLTLGTPITSNNNVALDANDDFDPFFDWVCTDNYGYGVWFNFVAPTSGNVNINLTGVGTGDDFYATAFLFNSRLASDNDDFLFGCDNYLTPDDDPFESDICASCADMANICQKADQLIGCVNASAANTNLTLQPRNLNPGETYYIMIDAYEFATTNQLNGNFTIQVNDAGGGPVRPTNDACSGAIDISTQCAPFPSNNIGATSPCSNDLLLTGASTENSVWYTYTPTVTGSHTIKYQYATGYHCFIGNDPGIQFGIYTSSNNSCTGTFYPLAGGEVSTGTTAGSVTLNLTAGQKYYIFIDGFAGNECKFEFQIYNGNTCCTADLGVTEGGPNITLCYGDQSTIGVTANPIDFGTNAGANPVIGWQYSATNPTIINPFNPANTGSYYVGQIDTATGGSVTKYYKDWQGYYPATAPTYDGSQAQIPLTVGGFPTGSTFNSATDTITVCVYAAADYFADMDLDLIAPDGSVYRLLRDQCGSNYGLFNVCFSNVGTATNVTAAACPGAGGELAGNYLPLDAWAGLNGEGINGAWKLRVEDDAFGFDDVILFGWNIEIRKAQTIKATPIPGVHHGDLTIINNDPFKYGSQVFWLTPVTFVNYNGTTLTSDSCYSYGTPVKVTLLEKVTTPLVTPICAAPGDGSNGITLTVTSPTGGMPGLPAPTVADTFTIVGTGAASGIKFPTRPVGESEVSTSFAVTDGQAWNVRFVDNNGCNSSIGGTYNQPNPGSVVLDSNVCDGATVAFSTSNPIPLFSQYRVILDFDSYPQDISWFIYNGNNQVVASGGGYGTTVGANTTTTAATINPNDGPFRFVLYDGFDDGLGSGGGTTNNGGSSILNFIRIIELHADGTVDTLFSQNYAFCSPIYCVGPAGSLFGQLDVNLGTPTGTFTTGVSVTLENNRTCTGTTVAGTITTNPNGTGTINTNAAGVNGGSSYSLQYTFTDQFGCTKTICGPLDVFPNITIAPTINCSVTPPVVSVNASCAGCIAPYVAEYSYNGGTSWTTATSANFQDIFTFAHVKNTVTGVIGCEVSSAKLFDCPTVLPLELIYIKATPIDNQYIQVTWATASELNTKTFEILRSTDGINFVKIGELPAAGNSNSQRNYTFDDPNAVAGILYYYQVREIDLLNHTNLTNMVNAKLEKENFELVSIYPNPTVDNTVITIYTKDVIDVKLKVFNDIGQIINDSQITLKPGVNNWNIDTKTWSKGVYYFIINNNDKPITRQVIKLHKTIEYL
ncbi:MAG: T9SS type A sorting domain-containing protein [Saprospirales bacterium]|nr:T9SS type A sorting domain-containing protein [Saprospirales bacterium]